MDTIIMTNAKPTTGGWFASRQAANRGLAVGVGTAFRSLHKVYGFKDVALLRSGRSPV